jgi:hypothetical protein
MNHWLNWIWGTMFQLVGSLCCHFVSSKIICWRIYGTRVFLNEAQQNFLKRGLFSRTLCQAFLGSVFVWASAKKMCRSLHNYVVFTILVFITPYQIANMSLNGLRRRVATRNKTVTKCRMQKLSIALDMGHRFSNSGTTPVSFH